MLWSLLALLTASSMASEGPWTTSRGLHNVYLGVMGERFRCFEAKGASNAACSSGIPLSAPVAKTGAKIFYRTGLGDRTDVAFSVPFVQSFATEPTTNPMLSSTTGIGLVEGRVRQRLGKIGDVGVAAATGVRTGAAHWDTRGRITNLGEGSTDLMAALYLGGTGPVAGRFHTTSMDVRYFYRLPLQQSDSLGRIPGDEVHLSSVSTFAVTPQLGLGLSADGFWRLWGEELDLSRLGQYGDDRWAALRASQLKLGGRAVVYPGERRPYLQLSVMRAVWAKNNPVDTTQVELAMGMDIGRRK